MAKDSLINTLILLTVLAEGNFERIKRQEEGDGKCVNFKPGFILFGGPFDQLEPVSIEECGDTCRAMTSPEECKAANYYANDQQCLLYSFNGQEPGRGDQVLPSPPEDAASLLEIRQEGRCPDTTTKLATTPTPDGDKNPMCCFWASIGECSANKFWMRVNCQKSCGTPGATIRTAAYMADNIPPECSPGTPTPPDYGPCLPDCTFRCTRWAAKGECDLNPFWMKQYCQVSCNSCGGIQRQENEFLPSESPGCENNYQYCNFWAFMQQCQTNGRFMRRNCCHACRYVGRIRALG